MWKERERRARTHPMRIDSFSPESLIGCKVFTTLGSSISVGWVMDFECFKVLTMVSSEKEKEEREPSQ
jgi:hypothetical protein